MESNKKKKPTVTEVVKEIKRRTRRVFSADAKIQIVLEGLRGEESIAAICRKHGIHPNSYFKWQGVPGSSKTPTQRRLYP